GNHPLTVTIVRTPRIASMTTAMLISGSGSSKGTAAQLNRPSMSTSRLQCRRTPGRASSSIVGTRRRLIDDALEQVPLDRAKGGRWYGLAWFRHRGVPGRVER